MFLGVKLNIFISQFNEELYSKSGIVLVWQDKINVMHSVLEVKDKALFITYQQHLPQIW